MLISIFQFYQGVSELPWEDMLLYITAILRIATLGTPEKKKKKLSVIIIAASICAHLVYRSIPLSTTSLSIHSHGLRKVLPFRLEHERKRQRRYHKVPDSRES